VEPRLVQLINHKADDPLGVLGDHANAVALPQTANEFLLEPGELEGSPFDIQDLRHIAPNHPTDVNTQLRLMVDRHVASFHVGPGYEIGGTGVIARALSG
jgi:hypothetical protein